MSGDSPNNDDDKYCADLVRRYDRDRFLCGLFAPDKVRRHITALYAFNIEIASTREMVSEPLIGQMRLKWWFDALDGIYEGNPPAHQVAVPLSKAVSAGWGRRDVLNDLIDARLLDLDEAPHQTLDDLVEYADRTSGALSELVLAGLGVDGAGARQVARHVGIAHALTGMVRALPLNFARRRVFLPTEVCRQAELEISPLLDRGMKNGTPPAMISAIEQVLDCARGHLADARRLKGDVPRGGISAILPGVLTGGYLKELKKHGNDPFTLPLRPPGPGVGGMLRLVWAAARGTI